MKFQSAMTQFGQFPHQTIPQHCETSVEYVARTATDFKKQPIIKFHGKGGMVLWRPRNSNAVRFECYLCFWDVDLFYGEGT